MKHIVLGMCLGALSCAVLPGCNDSRPKSIAERSEAAVADSDEILTILQSVRDPATAKEATPKIEETFPRWLESLKDIFELAGQEMLDGKESINAEEAKAFGEKMKMFQDVSRKIKLENQRLQAIHNLPIEFWNVVRVNWVNMASIVTEFEPMKSKLPAEALGFLRSLPVMFDEFGPERVVQIELPGVTERRIKQLADKLHEKVGESGKVSFIAAGIENTVYVSPIGDFEKFVGEIDFGEVTLQDAPQRRIVVKALDVEPLVEQKAGPPEQAGERPPWREIPKPAQPPIGVGGAQRRDWAPGTPTTRALSYEEAVEQYGKDRVVRFEVTNRDELGDAKHNVSFALSTLSATLTSYSSTSGTGFLAPIRDFDELCRGIEFGEIVERNDAEKTLKLKLDPARVTEKAAAANRRFGPDRARRLAARPDVPRLPGRLDEANPGQPAIDRFGGDAFLNPRMNRFNLPDASDPEFYKKLADMMLEPGSSFDGSAIDALLIANPKDIADKDIRQKIARNFREMAEHRTRGSDQRKAIRGLVLYGGKFSVPILINMLDEETLKAPQEVYDGLAENPDPKGAEAVGRRLGDFFNHNMAVNALRRMGPVAEDALMKAAPSNDANVSLAAVTLLGEVGTPKSLTLLGKALKSKNPAIVAAAKQSMQSIRERMKKPAEKG